MTPRAANRGYLSSFFSKLVILSGLVICLGNSTYKKI